MPEPVRLFVETTYHPAFRYGGWAFVREAGGAVVGQAGGERNTSAQRIELNALIAALQGVSPGSVAICSQSPGVIRTARLLAAPPAAGSDAAPMDDLELWAQALAASRGRPLTIGAAQGQAARFLQAWAEVGQDKAKGQGRFVAAIPKPNLAKLVLT